MDKTSRFQGIIDLGTNTFHLLIAEIFQDGSWNACYRERIYVKLGEGGVGTISAPAKHRAIVAMMHFREVCAQYPNVQIKAIGTAALRKANNAAKLLSQIKKRTSISVEIIDGDQEAALISSGVTAALPTMKKNYLIMDIGGGSVEFIYRTPDHKTLFSKSYEIGVVVLHKLFHNSDPITHAEIESLDQHLNLNLADLKAIVGMEQPIELIGASGTFDVLEVMLGAVKQSEALSIADSDGFNAIYEEIIFGSLADRLSNEMIPESRADLIIVAMQLIHFVLDTFNVDDIYISKYAMKEGILFGEIN